MGAVQTQGTCDTPFQQGELCRVCRRGPQQGGTRRCSRVVAHSRAMRDLLTRVGLVAAADAPVVLLGESGSGKEVVARVLHANSPRASRPFVAVNVAALPAELLESELFGHAKGAFTGATTLKRGLFEDADGGTLFLDEVAEMPLAMQAKLLRALQDGEVRRVGDTRSFTVDVRILCATHRDLWAWVESGRFREDLLYRLKVFTLNVPPLRERREDLLPLAQFFLTQDGHTTGRITAEAQRVLNAYLWPGNIRELSNAMRHAAALSLGDDVEVEHLPPDVVTPRVRRMDGAISARTALRTLADVEREHILGVLDACGGQQAQAARVLGIGRNTLWRKLRALSLADEH